MTAPNPQSVRPTVSQSSTAESRHNYVVSSDELFSLVRPSVLTLAEDRHTPMFKLAWDILASAPTPVKDTLKKLAQELLASEAIGKIGEIDTRLTQKIKALPDDVSQNVLQKLGEQIETMLTANAQTHRDTSKVMAEEIVIQLAQFVEENQGKVDTKNIERAKELKELIIDLQKPKLAEWESQTIGGARLTLALQILQKRVDSDFPNSRLELFNASKVKVRELVDVEKTLVAVVYKKETLFQPEQKHVLTKVLKALYNPVFSGPVLPDQIDLDNEIIRPLQAEIALTQAHLHRMLTTQLEATPILPPIGSVFSTTRHDSPRECRRSARGDSESDGAIYDVLSVGIERHGVVLVKAVVGIIERSSGENKTQLQPESNKPKDPDPIVPKSEPADRSSETPVLQSKTISEKKDEDEIPVVPAKILESDKKPLGSGITLDSFLAEDDED